MKDRLLNIHEIADYLGVAKSTIYKWVHQEYIPHIKMGKLVRFRLCEIDSWIEERSIEGRKERRISIL
jgi:excisionase family DNA binding protein